MYSPNFVIALVLVQETYSLLCHTCISFECPKELDQNSCEDLQLLAEEHIGAYREIKGHLPSCPKPTDNATWARMKTDGNFLKHSTCSFKSFSCGVTGFTILSRTKSIKPRVQAYGVVLGCTVEAKFREDFCDSFGRCNPSCKVKEIPHVTKENHQVSVNIQSCTGRDSECSNCDRCIGGNYCINETASLPKPPPSSQNTNRILNGVIIAGVVITALLAFLCCLTRKPLLFHGTLQLDQTEMRLQRKF